MSRSLVNVGNVSDHWKTYLAVWALAGLVVAIATGDGYFVSFLGVTALAFGLAGLVSLRRAAAARSIEQADAESLATRRGAVELTGRARAIDEQLRSPLSRKRCLAYQVEVCEYESADM
ncbi:MAG: hypothetical protein ABEI96_09960 [Haloarculaceae archaeon]